jgi:hypothetical protein
LCSSSPDKLNKSCLQVTSPHGIAAFRHREGEVPPSCSHFEYAGTLRHVEVAHGETECAQMIADYVAIRRAERRWKLKCGVDIKRYLLVIKSV